MFSALAQMLPRASRRCFAPRAATINAFSSTYSPKPTYNRPTAYAGLDIQPKHPEQKSGGWNNPVGDHIVREGMKPAEERWRENSRMVVHNLAKRQIADAYQGRSVRVKGGNFTEALKDLNQILSRNRVRATLFATARHEKKGVKRRRIQSEQWRKHFAHQVRKNVQLVHKIRRRGV